MPDQVFYPGGTAAEAAPVERAAFIRNTYLHLAGAILAFATLEAMLFQTTIPQRMIDLLAASRYSWLIVLGLFMGASYLATNWATRGGSQAMQYAGLGLYVVIQAVIFIPLLVVAASVAGPSTIVAAGVVTMLLFAGLTFTAFTAKSDFSWMGGILRIGGFVALGVIVASILFGFTLGVLFSGVMVLFAGGAILYETANILHRYHTSQHVAAALALFASVALLFWYVLRILMGSRR
ncbi:MAG: Bax inhibitor-1 family protein [Bryobacteraceae bacterium]|nr:Bax inhibitor-1 family protein [Bryobacteraceae bacterium]